MPKPCGCKIQWAKTMGGYYIAYCPLHEAAQELLEAAVVAYKVVDDMNRLMLECSDESGQPPDPEMMESKSLLKAAIAAAKGE